MHKQLIHIADYDAFEREAPRLFAVLSSPRLRRFVCGLLLVSILLFLIGMVIVHLAAAQEDIALFWPGAVLIFPFLFAEFVVIGALVALANCWHHRSTHGRPLPDLGMVVRAKAQLWKRVKEGDPVATAWKLQAPN